jgi:hypothetical protein
MNRWLVFLKTRELFAHQRLLVFWFVALIALALPWLWLSFMDREPVSGGAGNTVLTAKSLPHLAPGDLFGTSILRFK